MTRLITVVLLASAACCMAEASAQSREATRAEARRAARDRYEAQRYYSQQYYLQRPFESPFQVGPQSRPMPSPGSTTVPNR